MNENQGELFQELGEAVSQIRDVCMSHQTCKGCPLSTISGDCAITSSTPEKWRLASDEDIKKRIIF